MADDREIAARALASLDLTNLNEDCTSEDVKTLIQKAKTPHGPTAAICIWPRFVGEARRALEGTGIRIATVVNFPTGDEPMDQTLDITSKSVAAGADEIDMVIPYKAVMEGKGGLVPATVARIKSAAGSAPVKAILETGILAQDSLIQEAAELALEGGADFLKTSTGKVPVNATPKAAEIMLHAIKASGKKVGFKPAGGVKTVGDARVYLDLCDQIMGPGWATPATFRIGASGVLSALLAALDGAQAPKEAAGY